MIRAATTLTVLFWGLLGCSSLPQQVQQVLPHQKGWTDTQYTVAQLHERQGKLQKAQEIYRELSRRDPQNAAVRHRLGVVACRLGEHDQAIEHFKAAQLLEPHRAALLNDLGYAYFLEGDFEQAEQVLQRALEADPQDKRAANNLATVLGHQGKFNESFALFRRNLSEAESHANLAYVHIQRGEGQAAIKHYGRALTLDGGLRSASQALVQLAEMQQQSQAIAAAQSLPPEEATDGILSPLDSIDQAGFSESVSVSPVETTAP
jgi:Tfp pilus assembly protein PilF